MDYLIFLITLFFSSKNIFKQSFTQDKFTWEVKLHKI